MNYTCDDGVQHNIGHACTTRQCDAGLGDKVAMRWLTLDMQRTDVTFRELDEQSNRFANVLQGLGFSSGDLFFTFLPKMQEQFFAFLGALKLCVITGTLFSNFGEEALLDRLGDARAKGVITKKSFLKKINRIKNQLPALEYVLVVDMDDHMDSHVLSLPLLMKQASTVFTTPVTHQDTPSVLHYTSGSTGKPKGVLHVHRSIQFQSMTTRQVLGLRDNDIYWCTADQGWVTGTSYGIIGPWSLGITQVHYAGGYDAQSWLRVLEQESVTVWYTAPTVLRMLMREDESLFHKFNLSALRDIFSVGEPLNPEVISWSRAVLGKEIYDTWFQTETGAIMIPNRPGLPIRPGSMGKPLESVEAAIIADDGTILGDDEQGNLCIKAGWPSMFITYLNNETVYAQKFKNGYYYTGDTAYRDCDGYYWFMGRCDDVINTAGHLVSPFEVESALIEISEVAESGVIGVPDEMLYEKVVAYVNLHQGQTPSRELELKIRLHVANRVSSLATPQEIFFIDAIPKNKSGKIMRRVLKARYTGADLGDTSTLEV